MPQFYLIKDEKVYSGEYVEDFNSVTVYAGERSKTSQLNSARVDWLAEILLGHLIREGHAKPIQFIVVAEKNGIQVLKVIEPGPGGSSTVAFLVVGPQGVLGDFSDLEGAMAYFEELTEEPDDSDDDDDSAKTDFSPSNW